MIEYFQANMWQLWLLVCFICLIIELFSGDFFIICFSIGALGSMIATFIGADIVGQVIVFAVVSVLCLVFVRPVALKYLHRSKDERVSNVDAIIGRVGTVSQTIEAGGFGRVAIDGDDWKAQASTPTTIVKGAKVKVLSIDSIIITVEEV